MSKISQDFPLFDLNFDQNLSAEEIYTVRNFHEIRTQILEIAEKLAPDVASRPELVKQLIEGILNGLDSFISKENASDNGVTPIIKVQSTGNGLIDQLVNRILADYRQSGSYERAYLQTQLQAVLQDCSTENYFNHAKQESQELLAHGVKLSANFARMELSDGEMGVSEFEFAYYSNAYLDFNIDVPKPKLDTTFFTNANKYQTQNAASKVKAIIQVADPEVKSRMFRIIDQLAQIPTGAKILEAFAKSIEGTSYQIRPITEDDRKTLGHVLINAMNINEKQAIVFTESMIKNIDEDKLLQLAEIFAHEMFHAIVPKRSQEQQRGETVAATTIKEEFMGHEVARLVLWEQGLSPVRASGVSVMSPLGKYNIIWNLYSPHLYTSYTPAQITSRESSFQFPEWESYIEMQTNRLLAAGLAAWDNTTNK